jgi:hypothetical protein
MRRIGVPTVGILAATLASIVALQATARPPVATVVAEKTPKTKKEPKYNDQTKIIPKKAFVEALKKMSKDERVPVASSTLVEKGRGEDYYSVEKLFDKDRETTFWAEGAKGNGKNEWVVFMLQEETTHLEILPGAGKEQFDNFNRPKTLFLDVYHVKLPMENDEYKPSFKWLGRGTYKFKDKNEPVIQKLPVKLPELAMGVRTMYVGVIILQEIYKGQFDDTAINEMAASSVWGEQ